MAFTKNQPTTDRNFSNKKATYSIVFRGIDRCPLRKSQNSKKTRILYHLQEKQSRINLHCFQICCFYPESIGLLVIAIRWLLFPPWIQSYEIKSPPQTILWFRILGIFSVEYIKRLCVFVFQTCSNSQLLRRVL